MAAVQKNPKRYYWWRLRKNFFTQITIKKLRRSENGDKKAIIYLQMILMTIDNDGYIQFEGVEDDISDEIAIALDEEPEIVHETIKQLMDMRLIELVEEDYFLPEAKSGIDSEADSTVRSRRCRARQKLLQCNAKATNGNAHATQRRVEKSREEEIREEKELELENSCNLTDKYPKDPEDITSLFNNICKSYQSITDYMKYSRQLSVCIASGHVMNDYRLAFANAENSDYLKGLVPGKTLQSDFGWMLEHLDDIKNGKYN